jgi:hypothetical protein
MPDIGLGISASPSAPSRPPHREASDATLVTVGTGHRLQSAIGVRKSDGAPCFLTTRILISLIDGAGVSLDLRIRSLEFRRLR